MEPTRADTIRQMLRDLAPKSIPKSRSAWMLEDPAALILADFFRAGRRISTSSTNCQPELRGEHLLLDELNQHLPASTSGTFNPITCLPVGKARAHYFG